VLDPTHFNFEIMLSQQKASFIEQVETVSRSSFFFILISFGSYNPATFKSTTSLVTCDPNADGFKYDDSKNFFVMQINGLMTIAIAV